VRETPDLRAALGMLRRFNGELAPGINGELAPSITDQ
jgi:hypothetical protein